MLWRRRMSVRGGRRPLSQGQEIVRGGSLPPAGAGTKEEGEEVVSREHAAIPAAILCGLSAPPRAAAQSTFATITGAVTDPQGGAVPGATITAVNTRTGYKYTAKSNEAGLYTLANLLEGTYKLNAAAAGFQEYAVEDI